MQLELTSDQQMIQDSVRRFVEAEVKPHARDWDKSCQFPAKAVKGLAELGLMGMFVEPELGGSGLDAVSATIAIEEIARHDGSLALSVAAHNELAIGHVRLAGTKAQKERFLPAMAAGEKLGRGR